MLLILRNPRTNQISQENFPFLEAKKLESVAEDTTTIDSVVSHPRGFYPSLIEHKTCNTGQLNTLAQKLYALSCEQMRIFVTVTGETTTCSLRDLLNLVALIENNTISCTPVVVHELVETLWSIKARSTLFQNKFSTGYLVTNQNFY